MGKVFAEMSMSLDGFICQSQDSLGEIRRILRAVPCRKSIVLDRLPTRIPVPISPDIILGLTQNGRREARSR